MDWIGNKKSVFTTLGASNHTNQERQGEDYYATDPTAVEKLAKHFDIPLNIWEPACGEGHLSKRLQEMGCEVHSTDLIDRGFINGGGNCNFLEMQQMPNDKMSILTNPPYKYALEFIQHSLKLLSDNNYCIMLLKIQFLEGKKRYKELFSINPPKYMFVFSERLLCAKNGDFQKMKDGGGSAVAYAWYVWQKGYKGETIIKWI